MASLNSIFDSVGRATSTPRVNVNPSQGARSKLLSRSRQSTSPPVERVSESEREHINTQISDLEKTLQDLTSDYQRCRAESFEPEDAEIDSASPDFTVPSAEPFRQSRWGRRIKPPVVYSP